MNLPFKLPLLILSASLGLWACNKIDESDRKGAVSETSASVAQQSESSPTNNHSLENQSCFEAAVRDDDFYIPPGTLPQGRPGDLIRCQPMSVAGPTLSNATRIMYLSTGTHGKPIAVTGIVLAPMIPWLGSGSRPLVGMTVGTHGQGDQCAPSRLLDIERQATSSLSIMVEYEISTINYYLSQGIAVVITDYQGLGTPKTHAWLNRTAQGSSIIDAVRAAQRLPNTGIPKRGPVGFSGYSQGGGAAAAAAELLASYGPELNVVGAYVGAPPADIFEFLRYLDGTSFSGLQGYYLNGISELYPQVSSYLESQLNAAGRAMTRKTSQQCVFETIADYAYYPSEEFTESGGKISDILSSPAVKHIIIKDRLGKSAPAVPVLLEIGSNDEIVPPEDARRLASDWCDLGGTVEFRNIPVPPTPLGAGDGHIGNYLLISKEWLVNRFKGEKPNSTCEQEEGIL